MNKNRSDILMIARGTLDRNWGIYYYCKGREQEGTLWGAFAFLARKYTREGSPISRQRIGELYYLMKKKVEAK